LNKGDSWTLDVDGEEESPTDEWFNIEYRNILLEKLLK
jgi:hypothetical protein